MLSRPPPRHLQAPQTNLPRHNGRRPHLRDKDVVNGCDDYYESLWLGDPINDIPQFTRDIEAATFPDLVFIDEYDEYETAEKANSERSVAVWLMYPSDRAKAEQAAIDTLIADIVDEYSAYYFENEDRGIAPYIQKMIDGYAPLI